MKEQTSRLRSGQTPRLRSGQEGFTLLELLVVIAIIGLLSTIAVTSLNTARDKARDVKRLGDMASIRTAQEYYYDSNNTYGCIAAGRVSACTDLSTYINLATVKDGRWGSGTAICAASASTPYAITNCDYGFATVSGGQNFKIYFFLEKGTDSLAAGLHYIDNGGFH